MVHDVPMAMSAADVVRILDDLDSAGIPSWLDGGWAVDAVLGEQTRTHNDLDLIARVDDSQRLCDRLAEGGFRLDRGRLNSNFVLRDSNGREIDVHPVRFDRAGNGVYRMENGEDWIFPADGFGGVGRIGDRTVHTLTPDVQMLCHATGYEPGATDFHDMGLLHERLGTALLGPYRAAADGERGDP